MKEQQQLDTALERMARFREEMTRTTGPATGVTRADPTPTQPGKVPELVAELDRLRARVAEMEVEREEVRKKRSRSLSVPSPDLVGGPDVQDLVLHDRRVGQHQGALMETLISRGSTLAQSNRFSPCRMSARYGLRGVRVGEAKNSSPRCRLRRVSSEGPIYHDLTLVDSSDDDTPFVLPFFDGLSCTLSSGHTTVAGTPSETLVANCAWRWAT